MAKGNRGRRAIASRQCRSTPYPLPLHDDQKNCCKLFKKEDWEDATCSVCMECPHNAVLLLCSSHEKGCRPYMCGTSFRYSNCLDQYKKAYKKETPSDNRLVHDSLTSQPMVPPSHTPTNNCEATNLACPLCRGQVKGWTIVEPAREHLNDKQRSCVQDNCSFVGTFKELRKHVREEHPSAKPREVDPTLEQKWRRLERDRERDDVISTIRSSMPGARFFGDYVIEGNNNYGIDSDDEDDSEDEEGFDVDVLERNGGVDGSMMTMLLFFAGNMTRRHERGSNHTYLDNDDNDDAADDDVNNGTSLAGRLRREGRVLLGRSGRRRRRREANEEGGNVM